MKLETVKFIMIFIFINFAFSQDIVFITESDDPSAAFGGTDYRTTIFFQDVGNDDIVDFYISIHDIYINDEHNGNDYAFIQRGNHGHPRFKNGSNKIPAGSSGDLFMINGDNYDNDIHIFATGGSKYYTNTGGTGAEGGRVILSNIINHSDNRIKHN